VTLSEAIMMQFVRTAIAAAVFLLLGTADAAYAQRDQQGERQGKPEKQQGGRERGGPPSAQHQGTQGQSQQQNRGQERRDQPAQQQRQRAQQPQQQQQQQRASQPQQQQRAERPQQQRQQRTQQPQQQEQQRAQQRQQQASRTRQQAVAWQQQRGWVQQGAWQGHSTWQQNRAQRWENDHRSWAQRGGYGGYYIPQASFGVYFGSERWFRMRTLPTMYMGYPRFSYGGYSFLLVDPWPEYWTDNWYATDDVYIDYDDGYYLYNRSYPYVRLAITVALD
jgi:hypothetical protein